MGSLTDVQRNWETYAQSDPMWAALMDPAKIGGRWDPAAFFATGRSEIATVFDHLAGLRIVPDPRGRSLDFGCGVGRLSQALAARFDSAVGIDISPTMIELAREANQRCNCSYELNESGDLSRFEDEHFAFIYTSIVLQHLEPCFATTYMREFARVLARRGVVVFQVPDRVESGRTLGERATQLAYQLQRVIRLRTRARRALRRVGLIRRPPGRGEAAAEMHCVPEAEVRATMEDAGLKVVDVQLTNSTDLEFVGGLRFLESPPSVGFVSKQYCAIKP